MISQRFRHSFSFIHILYPFFYNTGWVHTFNFPELVTISFLSSIMALGRKRKSESVSVADEAATPSKKVHYNSSPSMEPRSTHYHLLAHHSILSQAKYNSCAGQLVTQGFTSPRRADGIFTRRLLQALPRCPKRPPLERKEEEVVPANTPSVRHPFGQKGLREAAAGLVKIPQVRFPSNPPCFRCLSLLYEHRKSDCFCSFRSAFLTYASDPQDNSQINYAW